MLASGLFKHCDYSFYSLNNLNERPSGRCVMFAYSIATTHFNKQKILLMVPVVHNSLTALSKLLVNVII